MALTIELPADLEEVLAEEAARAGMSLADYAVQLLTITVPPPPPLETGADVLAYWQANGVVGSRRDSAGDPVAESHQGE